MNIAPVYRDIYNWHRESLERLEEPDVWEGFVYPGALALTAKYPQAEEILARISDHIWRCDVEQQAKRLGRGA